MSVLVFLCFLKRRIADKNRADTGVCPYTHAAALNRRVATLNRCAAA